MCELIRIDSVWRIENQWGSIWRWSGHLVASDCTAYSCSDRERKLRKMLSQMFLLSYLCHCSFTANHKEIAVNNFASIFDNADHSSQMASTPSDTAIVNQIKILLNWIAQLYCCRSVHLSLLLEALTQKLHVWYASQPASGMSSGYLGQICVSRSSGQGQGHRN